MADDLYDKYKEKLQHDEYDQYKEPYQSPITKATNKYSPVLAREGTELLPALGSVAGPGGTLIGTGVKQALKRAFPNFFGEQPTGIDAAGDAAKDLLINNIVPPVVSKLGGLALNVGMHGVAPTLAHTLSNFPAVREGVIKQLTEQIQAHLAPALGEYTPIRIEPTTVGYQPMDFQRTTVPFQHISINPETVPFQPISINPGEPERYIGNFGNPQEIARRIADYQSMPAAERFLEPGNSVEQHYVRAPQNPVHVSEYTSGSRYAPATSGNAIPVGEEQQVPGGFKVSGGEIKEVPSGEVRGMPKGAVRQVPSGTTQTIVEGATKKGDENLLRLFNGGKIDASKTLEELNGKNADLYSRAMSPEMKTGVTELLDTIASLQKENKTDRIINFMNGKLMWGLPTAGLLTGHTAGAIALTGVKQSPVILNAVLSRIMENPETARLVTIAMQTPANAPQAGLIGRALTEILPRVVQGTAAIASTPEK